MPKVDIELPEFLNERGRMLFRTFSKLAGPFTDAEIPGLIVICHTLQSRTDADKEMQKWLDEYGVNRRGLRRRHQRERVNDV